MSIHDYPKEFSLRTLIMGGFSLVVAVGSGSILTWELITHNNSSTTLGITGLAFTVFFFLTLWIAFNPTSVRAKQTDEMLSLARQTLSYVQSGVDRKSAQQVCDLLLPKTAAIAVAITDCENVLGYAGVAEVENPTQGAIRTQATHDAINTGETIVITNAKEIGFPHDPRYIRAAIIVPLKQGRKVTGTLKFYFRRPYHINALQTSIAEGFGDLLSTQLASVALEEQTKLATSMELKALQAQINPHFLFNTINTIASFVRTDPDRARVLLREFATFYRATLENTGDLISLSREIEQTMCYFQFEVARFGTEKLSLSVSFETDVEDLVVPAFLIQPLVENAVRHARPPEGRLSIVIRVVERDEYLLLEVEDDGVGMNEEQRLGILHPTSSAGLGIAIKNVHDRVESYFGEGSHMEVDSAPGKGTTVRLVMNLDSDNLRTMMAQSKEETSANENVQSAVESADTKGLKIETGAAKSAAQVSENTVKEVDIIKQKSEFSGINNELRDALSQLDELDEGDEFDDDDDWDYEEEMRNATAATDEELSRAISDTIKDA